MTFVLWALIVGVLLTTMALAGSLLRRMPLSTGMLYLAVGVGLGPAGWALLSPDPLLHAEVLERAAEVAVLISLFAVGLKLGLPLSDKRWRLPLRLASLSMLVTIALVTAIRGGGPGPFVGSGNPARGDRGADRPGARVGRPGPGSE
jgi:NhaP-type Na+/H+ or K+/H+ antiporter